MMAILQTLLALGCLLTPTLQQQSARVDLGYQIHEGYLNTNTSLYKFSNIRYALPPIGELRFAAPVPPTGRSNKVENGSTPVLCPQARPYWYMISQQYSEYVLAGNASDFNFTAAEEQLEAFLATSPPIEQDPATTEDCLFLDVVVPQTIFERANSAAESSHGWTDQQPGVPVVIWIYGGSYIFGSKDAGDASGLVKASQRDGSEGIIHVIFNYRLGALGLLSGTTMQAAGGVPNAALHDQRLAIEWVTIMGESAGGGSVALQILAYGGERPVAFQKAIPQSPGFVALGGAQGQEQAALDFFALLNVTSLEEARQVDSAAVIEANARQIAYAPYLSAVYNVVVDGDFLPDSSATLLANGRHAKDIQVMVGHNANEAPTFAPPFVKDDASLRTWVASNFPGVPETFVDALLAVYPAVYDGAYPYSGGLERTLLIIAEWIFTCSTNFINKAFDNQTYAYQFQVPPAFHGQDVQYTYYNGQGDDLANGLVAEIAEIQQAYITNFIKTSDPNGPGLYPFPMQNGNASLNAWNATGVHIQKDPTANSRCVFWQESLSSL